MKYIVMKVKSPTLSLEVPFIFPELIVHQDMATMMKVLLEDQFPKATITPISAGFLSSTGFNGQTHGLSESLGNLKSREEVDDQLIMMCDYGSMYV